MATDTEQQEVLIVTGMSGAGRSTVANALEDLDWYVVDNLPPQMLRPLIELANRAESGLPRIAAVVDVRGRNFFADLREMIQSLREGTKVALLSFGTRLQDCLLAAEELSASGLSTTVADARFAKPLDEDLVRRLATSHEVLLTVEEGSIGGFASHVLHFLAREGLLDAGLKVRPLVLPDEFTDHAKPEKMYADAGLDATGIVRAVFAALGRSVRSVSA